MRKMTTEAERLERLRLACESEARRDAAQSRLHRRLILFAVVLGLAAASVVGCLARTVSTQPVADTADVAPDIWATDGARVEQPARAMPKKAFEGQKKPPCTPKRQVEINGGCWVQIVGDPLDDHCGDEAYEHQGRCYIPVKQAKRPPTSVDP